LIFRLKQICFLLERCHFEHVTGGHCVGAFLEPLFGRRNLERHGLALQPPDQDLEVNLPYLQGNFVFGRPQIGL